MPLLPDDLPGILRTVCIPNRRVRPEDPMNKSQHQQQQHEQRSGVWRWRQRLGALCVVLVAASAAAPTATAESPCCAWCLSQSDPKHSVITYDPLVHDQCSKAVGICCYDCTFGHGNPSYSSGVAFGSSSGLPEATAGKRVTFDLTGVTRVTYDFLAENQAKTSFVGNQSKEATKDSDGGFTICARAAGTIAFRGWGSDSCRQVTPEYTIKVNKGDADATCDAGTVKPATPAPSTTKPNESVKPLVDQGSKSKDAENCSETRGVRRRRADGSEYCECLGEWQNPPFCDKYSWTKTIVTVLGALAAVFSIAFTVRAYIKSKKAEREAADQGLDVMTEDEVETMRVSPAKRESAIIASSVSPAGASAASSARRSPVRSPARSPAPSTTSTSTTEVKTSRETTL